MTGRCADEGGAQWARGGRGAWWVYVANSKKAFYTAFALDQWGHFAAGAILVSTPVMALFFALQKNFVEGLTAGGVKG